MIIFLKRFLCCFFSIAACLFLVNLLIPGAAYAHTNEPLTVQQPTQSSNFSHHSVILESYYVLAMQAVTPTPTIVPTPPPPTVPVTPTPTIVPTPMPTIVPTPMPTQVPVPTTAPATSVPATIPVPTPTTVPTPGPTATPTTGSSTNTNSHTSMNALILTMGSMGGLLVIVGAILYFVYSRSS